MTATDHSALLDITVPAGWRVVPLWALFTRSKILGHIDEPMLSVFRDHGVVRKDSLPNLNKTAEDRSIYQFVDDGWLVVNRMKAFQGSVGVSFQRGIVSGHYMCFRPRHSESSRYLNWLLRSDVYRTIFHRLSRGVRPGQIEIDNDYLHSVPVLLPPLDVQRWIADFLDDQVTRIDQAIALRERQIELLGEMDEACVTEAVTGRTQDTGKGGGLSEGWRVAPLKRLGKTMIGLTYAPSDVSTNDIGTVVLRAGNVFNGRVITDDVVRVTCDIPQTLRLRSGDILICARSGSAKLVGKSALVPESTFGETWGAFMTVLRSDDWAYLRWVLQSSIFRQEVGKYQTSTIYQLTEQTLGDMKIPLPPVAERATIDRRLTETRAVTEALTLAQRDSRNLLAERKRSLITAAVTGEFDVTTASSRAADVVMDGLRG